MVSQSLRKFLNNLDIFNACVGLLGVIGVLLGALVMQWLFHEAPCPLCLLQRAGFIAVGLCFLMTMRYGNRASHWGMAILCSCAGIAVSIRQILLHITTEKGFGSAVLGLHMYSWCFIGFASAIVGSALVLMLYPEKQPVC